MAKKIKEEIQLCKETQKEFDREIEIMKKEDPENDEPFTMWDYDLFSRGYRRHKEKVDKALVEKKTGDWLDGYRDGVIEEKRYWKKAYAEAWKEINNIGADDPDDGDPESITCGNVVSSCLDILKKHMGEPTKSSEIKVNDCHCKLSQSETIPVSEDAKGSSEIPKNEIAGASRDQSIVDKRASGLNKGGVRKE